VVILRGLKGLAIEKNAKEVLGYLERLHIDLNKFREDFRLLGGHLTNAKTKYEEAEKKLDKFSDRFISSQTQTKAIP
jgi:DNA recombination protein RmuC